MGVRARAWASVAASLVALGAWSCTSLFGIQDGVLGPEDGGADATIEGGAGMGDSPASDGPQSQVPDGTSSDDAEPGTTDSGPTDAGSSGNPDSTGVEGGMNDSGTLGAAPDAGTGKVGTLGYACSTSGATACNGNDSQVALICQSGTWTAYGSPCTSAQRCDSTVGACADIAPGCAGLSPGATFCSDTQVLRCGVDLVTTSVASTCGPHQSCSGAACVCNADPQCPVTGTSCTGGAASFITCSSDSNGCAFTASTGPCTGGACWGDAGSAQCCTNTCTTQGVSACSGTSAYTYCSLNTQTGCLTLESFTCNGNAYGPICNDSSGSISCGCKANTDCAAANANACTNNICTCTTSANCSSGACCDTQVNPPWCTANGSAGGPGTCVNGVWQ